MMRAGRDTRRGRADLAETTPAVNQEHEMSAARAWWIHQLTVAGGGVIVAAGLRRGVAVVTDLNGRAQHTVWMWLGMGAAVLVVTVAAGVWLIRTGRPAGPGAGQPQPDKACDGAHPERGPTVGDHHSVKVAVRAE
jgi:hypothetical protein